MTAWEAVTLGDVAEFVRGINFKPEDVVPIGTPGTVVCMRTKNVQADLDLSDVWAVSESFVKRADQYLQTGDILVSSANSWNLVGKCCWIPDLPWRASFGGFVSVLRPDRAKVDPRFLFRWFSSHRIQTTVRSFGQQTTNISNLNMDRCLKLSFPLAPLRTQRQIAEVLDRAEALRGKRRTALVQLDILIEAIFLEMFGDSESRGWPEPTVESLAAEIPNAIRTGPFGSQLLHSEFTDSGVAVLGIDNAVQNSFVWGRPRFITERKYLELARYTVRPSDVLITIMGTCGRCAVVPDDIPIAINTKHLCCITLDRSRCLPIYLHACLLLHPRVLHRLGVRERGAVMPGLNMQIIKELRIPLPPLSSQREFAARVAAVDKLKTRQSLSLVELEALFGALQHHAFTGKL